MKNSYKKPYAEVIDLSNEKIITDSVCDFTDICEQVETTCDVHR